MPLSCPFAEANNDFQIQLITWSRQDAEVVIDFSVGIGGVGADHQWAFKGLFYQVEVVFQAGMVVHDVPVPSLFLTTDAKSARVSSIEENAQAAAS